MPPKSSKKTAASSAAAAASTSSNKHAQQQSKTNRNLTGNVSDAIKRVRQEQQFRMAIEQLVQLDCEEERADSLYSIGYCSDVVSLGALTTGGAHDDGRRRRQRQDDDAVDAVGEQQQQQQQQQGDHANDVSDSDSDGDADNNGDESKKRPEEKLWNAPALERAMPPLADWAFLSGNNSNTTMSSSVGVTALTTSSRAQKFIHGDLSGNAAREDDAFVWYRARGAKLDRIRFEEGRKAARQQRNGGGGAAGEEVSGVELARRVML